MNVACLQIDVRTYAINTIENMKERYVLVKLDRKQHGRFQYQIRQDRFELTVVQMHLILLGFLKLSLWHSPQSAFGVVNSFCSLS